MQASTLSYHWLIFKPSIVDLASSSLRLVWKLIYLDFLVAELNSLVTIKIKRTSNLPGVAVTRDLSIQKLRRVFSLLCFSSSISNETTAYASPNLISLSTNDDETGNFTEPVKIIVQIFKVRKILWKVPNLHWKRHWKHNGTSLLDFFRNILFFVFRITVWNPRVFFGKGKSQNFELAL